MHNGTFLPCYRQFIVKLARLTALLTISVVAFGAGDSIVLDTMSQELQRNFDALKRRPILRPISWRMRSPT